jgi:pteridine reductase
VYALTLRTALVTGAAKRLGATIARTLHDNGANVVVHYRESRREAESLCEALNRMRPQSAVAQAGDLRELDVLPELIAAAVDTFGALDILVNNASTFYPTPVGEITGVDWDDLVGTNLRAPLFLSQAAAPLLASTRGLIINLVDIHASRPLHDHAVYCVAKAGLAMLTRSLARELGPAVRVNGIAPGPVLWPEGGLDADLKAMIVDQTALKRAGTPEDVAGAVVYLATAAPFVTGQIIAVDGGRSIGW